MTTKKLKPTRSADIEEKKLDPSSEEYKTATIYMLIGDAKARSDKKAVEWLCAESQKKEKRIRNGVSVEVSKNIGTIRVEYAKRFLGYDPDRKKSAIAKAQRKKAQAAKAKALQDLFNDVLQSME